MYVGTLHEITQKLKLKDENIFFYSVESDGTIKLRKATEYEILAEEGLKDVYCDEPDGLWVQC
jgi:hypothetical protein